MEKREEDKQNDFFDAISSLWSLNWYKPASDKASEVVLKVDKTENKKPPISDKKCEILKELRDHVESGTLIITKMSGIDPTWFPRDETYFQINAQTDISLQRTGTVSYLGTQSMYKL